MSHALLIVAVALLPTLAAAQTPSAAAPQFAPAATDQAPGAKAPSPLDDELRQKLRAVTELLARHEVELRELKVALAQKSAPAPLPQPRSEPWYERIAIRGYTQLRYNQLPSGVINPALINEQADKSLGGTGGFFIRRARIIVFGDVHSRVSIYLQPDFASAISDQLNVSILRDWYADVFLDSRKEFRLRIGQSKVPFGFENLQSSQNRIPLDRSDALNSAVKDERDIGVFFYWAPDPIRKRFKYLVDSGLKGSGDYGVVGLGIFNGQTANRLDLNKVPHAILRLTWPLAIGSQFLEIGGGAYYGRSTVKIEAAKDGTTYTSTDPDNTFHDARGHLSIVLYPQPFGIVTEWNVGIGPSLGRTDPTVVDNRFLYGGYLQIMYKLDGLFRTIALIPYVRGTLYEGGKKFFTNAPRYEVREVELGAEWQIVKSLEIVVAYMASNRTSDKHPYEQEYGHATRLQAQVSF